MRKHKKPRLSRVVVHVDVALCLLGIAAILRVFF